jgi:hypothetical protein
VGELEKYKLDLVGVQEVRWEGEGYQTADSYAWGRERCLQGFGWEARIEETTGKI